MTDEVKKVETTGPKTQKPSPIEQAIARGVENWISENLRNTAFSRNTEAWNILQGALPKLPGAIVKEVK